MNHRIQDPSLKPLREIPTELTREQLADLIGQLPNMPIQKSWYDYFTTKFWIMTTFSTVGLILTLFFINPFSNHSTLSFEETEIQSIPNLDIQPSIDQIDNTLQSDERFIEAKVEPEINQILTLKEPLQTTEENEEISKNHSTTLDLAIESRNPDIPTRLSTESTLKPLASSPPSMISNPKKEFYNDIKLDLKARADQFNVLSFDSPSTIIEPSEEKPIQLKQKRNKGKRQKSKPVYSSEPLHRIYTKTISVSNQSRIIARSPRWMDIHMSGTMSFNDKPGGMKILGKHDELVFQIDGQFEIHTWDKSEVKQEVEIFVRPEEMKEAEALLDHLGIDLEENAAGVIQVDGNMNIAKLTMRNSFLSKDKTRIHLDDGEQYHIKSLRIRSTLYIPKQQELKLEGDYVAAAIGDLEGRLELETRYSNIIAKRIGHLKTNMTGTTIECDYIKTGDFTALESDITIKEVGELNLSSQRTKYTLGNTDRIVVRNSFKDEFDIKEVSRLNVQASEESEFEVQNLFYELEFNGVKGKLRVRGFSPETERCEVNTQSTSIYMDLSEVGNYLLHIKEENPNSWLPKDISLYQGEDLWEKIYLKGDANNAKKILINGKGGELRLW